MNNVIKKMAQFEQKEIETKLASHNVHLAITDDMIKLTSAIEKNYESFDKITGQLKSLVADLNGRGNTMLSDANKLDDLNNKFFAMAKELGVDPNDSDVYVNATDVNWSLKRVEDTLATIKSVKL
jgi:superoxide dismutase